MGVIPENLKQNEGIESERDAGELEKNGWVRISTLAENPNPNEGIESRRDVGEPKIIKEGIESGRNAREPE